MSLAEAERAIESLVKQNLAQDFVEVDEGDFQALKVASNTFINKVELIANQTYHIHMMLKNNSSLKSGIRQFYQFMRQSTNFTRQALQLQHIFEQQLNSFLGRTIYLTYVTDKGKLLYFDDANIGKLYQGATKNVGRGNISAAKVAALSDVNDLADQLRDRLKKSEQLRSHVYNVAIERWQSNVNDEDIKVYNPSKNTFYWRLWDNHHISGWTKPITSKGIIAQGYAGAVINEDPQIANSNLEFSLKALYQNHIQKDSIGAVIKGDVVWNENGQIQFAIKQGSFSTARFGQYLILAYNIQQIQQISKEEFQKFLPQLIKLNKITNSIIQDINSIAVSNLQQSINTNILNI